MPKHPTDSDCNPESEPCTIVERASGHPDRALGCMDDDRDGDVLDVLTHERHACLSNGIEILDEDDREIILLRHTEQLGNQAAADFLGLTPAAAGMRHTRALRKLKEILTDRSTGG